MCYCYLVRVYHIATLVLGPRKHCQKQRAVPLCWTHFSLCAIIPPKSPLLWITYQVSHMLKSIVFSTLACHLVKDYLGSFAVRSFASTWCLTLQKTKEAADSSIPTEPADIVTTPPTKHQGLLGEGSEVELQPWHSANKLAIWNLGWLVYEMDGLEGATPGFSWL